MNTNISTTPNKVLMQNARESLRGKWGISIGGLCIAFIVFLIGSIIPFANLILAAPISVGLIYFYLKIARNEYPKIDQIFSALKGNRILSTIVAGILSQIFIMLGLICLIIPGIILSIAFQLVYYILADNPEINGFDAIKKSYHLMNGNKWKYVCLSCRFIGWYLLALCTLGIGFLWLIPYFIVSIGNFYRDIIGDNHQSNIQEPKSFSDISNV